VAVHRDALLLGRDASPTTASYLLVYSPHNRSKKLTSPQCCDSALPRRLGNRALHRASAPSASISTAPKHASQSSSLSLSLAVTFCSARTRHGLLHLRSELHATNELYTDENHTPTSLHSQASKRCCAERACCRPMFQVFQMFHMYVASVLYGCCKVD
jgi:hypothetical protein